MTHSTRQWNWKSGIAMETGDQSMGWGVLMGAVIAEAPGKSIGSAHLGQQRHVRQKRTASVTSTLKRYSLSPLICRKGGKTMRAVSAWAALTGLVLLVAAVAEAINPKWLRQPRRARAFGIYFGLAVVSLFIAVAVSPARVSDSKSENKPMVASESRPAKVIVAPTEESPSVREYQALASLLTAFESLTDLQQEEWNLRHQWAHWVQGEGAVSEVTRTSPFSEIKGAAYEVTVELPGGDRGVLFYPVDQKELVLRLSVGSVMTFQGRLKKIQDWGFWRSGYVRVE